MKELHMFLGMKVNFPDLQDQVSLMEKQGDLVISGSFIHLPEAAGLDQVRIPKQERALRMASKARTYARIIAAFPFVRAIALSGSVSKMSAGEGADLDYFVITASNRLWIARSLLHLFKKLTFLTGHQHCYCMNYFIAEDHLLLPYRNIFTAIELQTLVPLYGPGYFSSMKTENPWTAEFLPNHDGRPLYALPLVESRHWLKSGLEWCFNRLAPGRLNLWLMRLTDYKWRRKYAALGMDEATYDRQFMTRTYLSKNHPQDFQKKVLEAVDDELVVHANFNTVS